MPYEIELTQSARRDYLSLPSNDRERIRKVHDREQKIVIYRIRHRRDVYR
jgi:mRNA-degrading endonuclease RelE of RelBE toxin-antitoxin system